VEYHLRKAFNITQTIVEIIEPANSNGPVLAAFLLTTKNYDDLTYNLVNKPSAEFHNQVLLAETQLRSSLPRFMIPDLFIPLKRIPLTHSGKIDRRALREWATGTTRNDLESYGNIAVPKTSPTTAVEKTLHRIWTRLLALEPESVGIVCKNLYISILLIF